MTEWMPHPLYALTTRPYLLAGAAPAWADAGGYWVTLKGGHDLYLQTSAEAKARRAAKPKTAAGDKTPAGSHWVTINGTHVLVDGQGNPVDPKLRERLSGGPGGAMTPAAGPTWDGTDAGAIPAMGQALVENLDALALLHGDNALPVWQREGWRNDPSRLGMRLPNGEMPLDAALANAPFGPHADYTDTDAMEKRVAARAGLRQRQVADVTREWADGGPKDAIGALELNKAAEAEFGVPGSPWVDERLQTMRRERQATAQAVLDKVQSGHADPHYPYDVTRYTGDGWHSYPPMMEENRITGEVDPKRLAAIAAGKDKPPVSQATQRKALRAMYELTQEDLKALPGDSVTLYRGIDWPAASPRPDTPGGAVDLSPLSMPLSSWTLNPDTARRFGNVIVAAKVPKRRILSTQHTGLGTIYEHEVVVLGAKGDQGQIWATSPYHSFAKPLAEGETKAVPLSGGRWVTLRGGQHVYLRPKAGREALTAGAARPLKVSGIRGAEGMWDVAALVASQQPDEAYAAYRFVREPEATLSRSQFLADPVHAMHYAGAKPWGAGELKTEHLAKRAKVSEDGVKRAISAWAGGELDGPRLDVSVLHKAAVEEFGGVMGPFTAERYRGGIEARKRLIESARDPAYGGDFTGAMLGLQSDLAPFESRSRHVGKLPAEPDLTDERKFLRQMYTDTQADLAKLPGDTVTLYRGIRSSQAKGLRSGSVVRTHKLEQPLSSWSFDPTLASSSGYDAVLVARIPKARILSTWRTGLGTSAESEVVVLGGNAGDQALVYRKKARKAALPTAEAKARAKPKTAKTPAGSHWVTIRGTHVLVDGDGNPVDPAMRERLGESGAAPTLAESRAGSAGEVEAFYADVMAHPVGGEYEPAAASWLWAAEHAGVSLDAQRADVSAYLQEALGQSKVAMRVTPGVLAHILEDGRVKNQYESGTSQGMYNPDYRRKAEERLFGGDMAHVPDRERPVYGYMEAKDGAEVWGVQHYGPVTLILKDSVRKRTTVTLEDSLIVSRSSEALPPGQRTSRPVPLDRADWTMLAPRADVVTTASAAVRLRRAGKPIQGDPLAVMSQYRAEAQIHGGVQVSDIERVRLPQYGLHSEALARTLRGRGIQVEFYDDMVGGGGSPFSFTARAAGYPVPPWETGPTASASGLARDYLLAAAAQPKSEAKADPFNFGKPPKSGAPDFVWRTINGAHVRIGGDGQPVDATWRERLARGAGGPRDPAVEAVAGEGAERTLETAQGHGGRALGGGVNETYVTTLGTAEGQGLTAVVKLSLGDNAADNVAGAVASYRLSQGLGLDVVPAAVVRRATYQELLGPKAAEAIPPRVALEDADSFVLSAFVPGFKPAHDRFLDDRDGEDNRAALLADHPDNGKRLQAMLVLDDITGQWDRHAYNWGEDKDGRLWAVDNDVHDPDHAAKQATYGYRPLNAPSLIIERGRGAYVNRAPFVPLTQGQKTRWAKLSRADFDNLFEGVDYPGQWGGVDAMWGNLQRILRDGGIGDPKGPVLDLAGAA